MWSYIFQFKLPFLQKEREIALFNLRGEQASKMNEYEKKVGRLQREVEKYQTLAAIEELTRKAKRDTDASPLSPSTDLKSFLMTSTVDPIPESLVPKSKYSQTEPFYLTSVSVQTDAVLLRLLFILPLLLLMNIFTLIVFLQLF